MTTAPLDGFTIGVTGDRRVDEQVALLVERGAECVFGSDDVVARALADGRLDGLTIAEAPAVASLFAQARSAGVVDDVVAAFEQIDVFCLDEAVAADLVGYVPAAASRVTEWPDLHRLIDDVTRHVGARAVHLEVAGKEVWVQGRVVTIDAGGDAPDVVRLSHRERAVLGVLLERPGAVHSKRDLLRRVWRGDEADEHLVEVTIGRLRQRLGSVGDGIETVVRRGYRIAM